MKKIISFFKKIFTNKKKCKCSKGSKGCDSKKSREMDKSPDIEVIEKKSEIVKEKKVKSKKKNDQL